MTDWDYSSQLSTDHQVPSCNLTTGVDAQILFILQYFFIMKRGSGVVVVYKRHYSMLIPIGNFTPNFKTLLAVLNFMIITEFINTLMWKYLVKTTFFGFLPRLLSSCWSRSGNISIPYQEFEICQTISYEMGRRNWWWKNEKKYHSKTRDCKWQ